jgi:hypothetical protein
MDSVETALRELTREDRIVTELMKSCGVGPLIATALRATVGKLERFKCAWTCYSTAVTA